MSISMCFRSRWVRRIAYGAIGGLAALAFLTFPLSDTVSMVQNSDIRADKKHEFFLRTLELAKEREIVVLFKDNSLHHEGFHELLLKGASDFPTWRISRGQKIIQKYGRSITFRSEYERVPPIDGPIEPGVVLVLFQHPDEDDVLKQYPGAEAFAKAPNISEEQWLLTGKGAVKPTTLARIFYAK
jgi:hypothetical protein